MTSVLYAVGSGSAAASSGGWLLADAPPTSPVVRDFWTRLGSGLDLSGLRRALSDTGLASVRSLAVVITAAPGLILVRGDASVVLDGPERQTVVGSRTDSAWTEAALPAGTAAVTLALAPGEGGTSAQIPAVAGVFPASVLVVRWAPSPAYDTGGEEPLAAPTVDVALDAPLVPPPPTVAPPVVPPPPSMPPPTREPVDEPTELLVPPPPQGDGFFDQEALPDLPAPEAVPPRPPGPPPSAPVEAGHGVLLISTGDRVVLDRGAVLGRSPEWNGADERHLVTVVGHFGDVSRSHVGVTVGGGLVQVEDLGSTNGTLVTQPGASQHLLRVGVPEVLEPGALVTLSRDVSFTYEIAPR